MGIPYTKTAEDDAIMERDLQSNRTLKHLKNINFYKFSVGDVLNCEERYNDKQPWKIKLAACGLPLKYVYVFENELGVGYIRRLSVTGEKFVDTPVCVVNFDPSITRFMHDPNYADHILFGAEGELDVKSAYKDIKKKRDAIHRANDKIRVKLNSTEDIFAFLKSLKPGDIFWSGYSRSSIRQEPNTVVYVNIDRLRPERTILEYKPGSSAYSRRDYMGTLLQSHYFLTKPKFVDEIL